MISTDILLLYVFRVKLGFNPKLHQNSSLNCFANQPLFLKNVNYVSVNYVTIILLNTEELIEHIPSDDITVFLSNNHSQ